MKKNIVFLITVIIMFLCNIDNIVALPTPVVDCTYQMKNGQVYDITGSKAGKDASISHIKIILLSDDIVMIRVFNLDNNQIATLSPGQTHKNGEVHWSFGFTAKEFKNDAVPANSNKIRCPEMKYHDALNKGENYSINLVSQQNKSSTGSLILGDSILNTGDSENPKEEVKTTTSCGPYILDIKGETYSGTLSMDSAGNKEIILKSGESVIKGTAKKGENGIGVFGNVNLVNVSAQIVGEQFHKIFANVNDATNTFTCPEKLYIKDSISVEGAFELTTDPTDAVEVRLGTLMDTDAIYAKEFPFNYEGTIDFCAINELIDWIKEVLGFVQLGVIVIVMLLSILDYVKALTASDSDAMKKANKSLMTRIIVIALILLVGPLVQFVLDLFTNGDISTCGIA